MRSVLVIGAGFLGRRIASRLATAGLDPVVASRHPPSSTERWTPLDATDAGACSRLAARLRPDAVVLAHGPSDVDWCEAHPDRATRLHVAVARNALEAWPNAWRLLVSTDNVFPGTDAGPGEAARPSPANGYGHAKLAAERQALRRGAALVWRVSLTYGWPAPGDRGNFFSDTVAALKRGDDVHAPQDQWTTPVLVEDVAEVAAALLRLRPEGVLHLGGPERVSRLDWARSIARAFGGDPSAVVAVRRRDSRYGCRPANSCLRSERADCWRQIPVAPRGVADALQHLSSPPTKPLLGHRA